MLHTKQGVWLVKQLDWSCTDVQPSQALSQSQPIQSRSSAQGPKVQVPPTSYQNYINIANNFYITLQKVIYSIYHILSLKVSSTSKSGKTDSFSEQLQPIHVSSSRSFTSSSSSVLLRAASTSTRLFQQLLHVKFKQCPAQAASDPPSLLSQQPSDNV